MKLGIATAALTAVFAAVIFGLRWDWSAVAGILGWGAIYAVYFVRHLIPNVRDEKRHPQWLPCIDANWGTARRIRFALTNKMPHHAVLGMSCKVTFPSGETVVATNDYREDQRRFQPPIAIHFDCPGDFSGNPHVVSGPYGIEWCELTTRGSWRPILGYREEIELEADRLDSTQREPNT